MTNAQANVLRSIAATGWWPKGTHSSTRFHLNHIGMIDVAKGGLSAGMYVITDAGRAALAKVQA